MGEGREGGYSLGVITGALTAREGKGGHDIQEKREGRGGAQSQRVAGSVWTCSAGTVGVLGPRIVN